MLAIRRRMLEDIDIIVQINWYICLPRNLWSLNKLNNTEWLINRLVKLESILCLCTSNRRNRRSQLYLAVSSLISRDRVSSSVMANQLSISICSTGIFEVIKDLFSRSKFTTEHPRAKGLQLTPSQLPFSLGQAVNSAAKTSPQFVNHRCQHHGSQR